MPPKRRSQTTSSSARAAKKAKPAPSSESSPTPSSSSHTLPESTILKPYDISKVYRLLEPGPVLLVTTSNRDASKSKTDSEHTYNVMTMGFHMVVQHSDPPLLACVIGPWDHSYKTLQETKECVLCIPGADLVEQVVDIGNVSSAEVDKFSTFNLTKTRASEEIQHGAPLIEECLASIECRVHDRSMVKRYNMWVLEVVGAWTNGAREEKRTMHHKGIGNFVLDGEEVDLRERMVKWKEFQDDDEDEEG
ncbi:hypothetical protein EXIGLDRAFT_837312 [Exidia glandulosa HHB12029]|uniref:Flavin reductase like domain-containing protein n=1 Tax=Exidia glandulosa HHB12029 TaxID=1314781 RepID=A0A165GYL6_EXIGL|nr:hypothetical protein EXIGLDRAFT_837312 [Exidia glandulosa HHB12029]